MRSVRKGKVQSKRPPRKRTNEDLTQKAYNALRNMLLFNEIAVGQKIHYLELAEKLSVSPTPVIQALKWLQFQGLVRHENNRGFYLEDISIEEVDDLYQIRRSLELTLLDRSRLRLDKAGLSRLKASLETLLDAGRKNLPKLRLVKDMEFHLTLASLSGGRAGCLLLQHVFDLLYLKYRTYLLMLNSGDEGHKKIFDCVATHDFGGASETLSHHISAVGRDVVKQLRSHEEEKETFKSLKIGLVNAHERL
jgi:DNA-binding GntR family transcriptional regulator